MARKPPKFTTRANAGYERKDRDAYRTPGWVTDILVDVVRPRGLVWEPAAGEGDMVEALRKRGLDTFGTDIVYKDEFGFDFIGSMPLHPRAAANAGVARSIISNPPFALAYEFVVVALERTKECGGMAAMLLPHKWDCAIKTRGDVLRHPASYVKIPIGERIVWVGMEKFDKNGRQVSPYEDHAWFVWDWSSVSVTGLPRGFTNIYREIKR